MKSLNRERDREVEHEVFLVDGVSSVRQASRQPVGPQPAAEPPVDATSGAGVPSRFIAGSTRDEIVRRVAAFRELQVRVGQERRRYCDAILAETRTALGK